MEKRSQAAEGQKKERRNARRSTAPASPEAHARVVEAFQLWEATKPEDRVELLQKLLGQWERNPI